jgi:sarcosine oxidase subunit alpha
VSSRRIPGASSIKPERPLSFRWAGRTYQGFEGDTLASALLANGIDLVGRSFKYHRRRGLLAAGLEEPNAIVQVGTGAETIPNLKATQVELTEGLAAAPVNAWPSLDFDLLAVNSWVKRFIPAAFYYKTFKWPDWRWFEPSIRRAAGLGVAPALPDPDGYEHRHAHVDVLVVGSGAAGLTAALAAGRLGLEVLLVESDQLMGGGLLAEQGPVEGRTAAEWLANAVSVLKAQPNVTLMPRTLAFGYYDHDLIGLREGTRPGAASAFRERLWKVRAGKVILATGAYERPLPFVGNDLPGVMLASAAQTYAVRFGVAVGRRVVIATNNDSGYGAAAALADRGIEVAAILDSRTEPSPSARAASKLSDCIRFGAAPAEALGRKRVEAVRFGAVRGGQAGDCLACDALLVSGGWSPAVHLHSQAGGRLRYCENLQAFLPADAPQGSTTVGAAAGRFDMDAAIASAVAAVRGGQHPEGSAHRVGAVRQYADGAPEAHSVWLDFQNDVTVGDVQLAARENFRSVEHVKRYTTLGMASDQGKTSNVPAIQMLGGLLARTPEAVGTTKFRPPFDPVTIGAFAGRAVGSDLHPAAELAAADLQRALGARFEEYGRWLRPAFFPREGEQEPAAVTREVLAVRRGCGLFEASPLGKIEVKGPDAGLFLDRMYVNTLSSLKVGRCRYALMLSEHGVIYDDGVVARLGEDHFLVGTTSGHAAAVAERFEEWLQCEWPGLRVLTQDVTTCWAVMTLAGPRAREVLGRLGTDIGLAPNEFPHLAVRSGNVSGLPARVQRVSFSGELSYEIAVPWRQGAFLWKSCMEAGSCLDITPFGVEALMAMRIEKGFLHVGADTDGTTFPQDVGLGGIIARKEADFVGRRSTMQADGRRDDRRQLVGLEMLDGGGPLSAGAHVVAMAQGARVSEGWVTSATHSPTLGRPLALALVTRGRARLAEEVTVWDLGRERRAQIVEGRFFDPAGERMNG